jgi:Fe-S cluster assembly protein SufD
VIVKGVLDDSSKVDFEGLTKIDRGAKNSNAWLESRLLLISDKATGRAVPNLEISENEVKAGHAATVGKIDETEIFYLMSRGLPRNQAVKLIVDGFIGDLSKWKK